MRCWIVVTLLLVIVGCNGRNGMVPPATPPGLGIAPRTSAEEAEWASRRQLITSMLPEIERHASDEFLKQRMPALAVALLVDGQLFWWQTFGVLDLEAGGTVDQHTVFRIGSVTKTFTGMALLKLRDEGRVSFDARAADFVPEFGLVVYPTAERVPITLRQLLTHTSGLPRVGSFDKGFHEPVSDRDMAESLRGVQLEHTPGTQHLYSNFGYCMLGSIIGEIAQMPYRDYVSQQILRPIGMASAVWDAEAVPADRLATGYAWSERDKRYVAKPHGQFSAAEAAGGLYASLDDLARYLIYHMTAWPPGARPDLPPLSNATLRESHLLGGFQTPGGGTGVGWGVGSRGGHSVGHTGSTALYAVTVEFLPKQRLGFIAMSNSGVMAPHTGRLAGSSLELILRRLGPAPGQPGLRLRRVKGA